MGDEDTASKVRDFVQGVTRWDRLMPLGVRIEFGVEGVAVASTYDLPILKVSVAEIAHGILARAQTGDIREYAQVLLAASFIDLGPLEHHPLGDQMLGALWDAAAGRQFDDAQLN